MNLFKKNKQPPIKLIVLASGRGSNFEAIYGAIQSGKLNAEIIALISDKTEAKALQSAEAKNIKAVCFDRKSYNSKDIFELDIINTIKKLNPDLLVLAGYMRILGEKFITEFSGKIINIHPALLPAFTGIDAQKQAMEYGVKLTGCTVHYVDSGVDTGPIIMQRTVPVLDNDTEESLSLRIMQEEHDTYWRAIKLIADGKVTIIGRKVIIKE